MTFIEAMKELGVRIICGDRWAVANEDGTFTVYERTPYMRKTVRVFVGINEDAAVAALLNERD